MLTSGTTAAAIDAFERRLTTVNGGHFLIAAKGGRAWPISADEAAGFRALYRRRMMRARWIRRLAIIGFIPLLYLSAALAETAPDSLDPMFANLGLAILLLPFAGMIQHTATSDLTLRGIERSMGRRFTLDPQAVTPAPTTLGQLAQRLFLFTLLGEIAIAAIHLIGGRDEFAQHMRVLMDVTVGNEGRLAWVTGTIGRFLPLAILAAALIAMIDRRRRRQAAGKAKSG